MLTKEDVQWIKNNRKETTWNRTTEIKISGEEENGRHPVTDEPITESYEYDVKGTVTEVTSAFKTDISLEGGVLIEKGDLWVVIDLSDLPVSKDKLDKIKYHGDNYIILAADYEGLGELNRVTIVARLES